ncbi:hypothetical protein CDAR_417301 [Caerostris darwini]|uniref:Uncharacterized protein n=1 Tax=Caerostris darwini TaxID=1538125 RepID=A0AAV4X9A5_9ARAC|nr:hypothetical protein CDAR_417301 [Caerostris darwini]
MQKERTQQNPIQMTMKSSIALPLYVSNVPVALCKSCFYRHSAATIPGELSLCDIKRATNFYKRRLKVHKTKPSTHPHAGVAHHLFLLGYGIKRE